MSNLSTQVRRANDATTIIDIYGNITGTAENTLMDAYTLATANSPKTIILNFNNLTYMNSSGIGLLVTLLIRIQRQQQRLLAFGLSEHYQQIFSLTRLDEAIGVYRDEEAALAASMAVPT